MTTVEDEVVRLNEQCKKMVEGEHTLDDAVEVIDALEKIEVTIDVLTKTRIGMTINDLRKKATDEKLAKRAKALIKKWKVLIDSAAHGDKAAAAGAKPKPAANGKPEAAAGEKTKRESPKSDEDEPPTKKSSNSTAAAPPAASNSNHHSFTRIAPVYDEKRKKMIELLTKSLRDGGELPDGTQDPEEVAQRIEAALHEEHSGTTQDYFAAARSRVFNLRDKKNPGLRENVLIGVVSPKKFARMSTEEMASDEMKKQREEFHKEGIMEHQMAVQEGTPSDMFRCGRCGKNNCTYNQMQTRSADEPMTTFVFCRTCGNRWKFC
ncbi:Transcription elongation factor [Aphelenchoides fujianensis]|nr:Transcription elongation factor [Aphelenchoides fujianensis]